MLLRKTENTNTEGQGGEKSTNRRDSSNQATTKRNERSHFDWLMEKKENNGEHPNHHFRRRLRC
uniref:Uncharacterized protein n=1 Tax=Nelumbo nucifera TaxID=4432 RepID=A0A822XTL8_NELNU|nr:TPA_asm: hypothetical protein HUJ06_023628 [Nelumbo nucifera]